MFTGLFNVFPKYRKLLTTLVNSETLFQIIRPNPNPQKHPITGEHNPQKHILFWGIRCLKGPHFKTRWTWPSNIPPRRGYGNIAPLGLKRSLLIAKFIEI